MTPKLDDPVQEQLIQARRSQILDAATTVFAQKGFHRATIRDVAGAAGVADGTIYNYFDNKSGLLLGILNRLNETEQRDGDFEAGTQGDLREFMRVYLSRRYQYMMEQGFEAFQIVLSEVLVNAELRDLYYQQVLQPTFELTEPYIQALIDQGMIEPLDVKLWMRAVASMTLGILILRIMGDPVLRDQWDEVPDFVTDLILSGIVLKEDDAS